MSSPCPHSLLFSGLCADCSSVISPLSSSHHPVVFSGRAHTLYFSSPHFLSECVKSATRILGTGKLVLVMDIDHTMLHAHPVKEPRLEAWGRKRGGRKTGEEEGRREEKYEKGQSNGDEKGKEQGQERVETNEGEGSATRIEMEGKVLVDKVFEKVEGMYESVAGSELTYLRLRPHLKEFLEMMEPYFELYIYTMGTRKYAEAVMKCIDPDHKYFKKRALCRDDTDLTFKSISRLLPCPESMIFIVDDTPAIWSHMHEQVIWVPKCMISCD